MSGPDYPHGPLPGSNGLGMFRIGISPLGTIADFDVWTTIISQYANSDVLDSMIETFNAATDQTENIDNFFDMVWNVLTAQGWGLDVWGRIVVVPRTLTLNAGKFFGFEEAVGPNVGGFGQAPFYAGTTVTNNYVLTDADYRTLILAKAFANICDGSIPSLNQLVLSLFTGGGEAYVTDGEDMTMTYTFAFPLSSLQQAIVENSGVLPKPDGVTVSYVFP